MDQSKINQIEQQIQDQKLVELVKLSQRSIPLAVIISLIIPIGGYIYTGRWAAFFKLLLIGGFLGGLGLIITPEDSKGDTLVAIACAGTLIAPIDNGIAISSARKQVKNSI